MNALLRALVCGLALFFLVTGSGEVRASVEVVIQLPAPDPLITAEGQWSLIEDPPHSNTSATGFGSGAFLFAGSGFVESGVDIGYSSVGGPASTARAGFYFDPSGSFVAAINYDLSVERSSGAGGIGFGIGEDIDGMNSAGIVLGFANGSPLAFTTAARVNDVDQGLLPFSASPSIVGRFFLEYDSITKDVVLGVSADPDASSPTETKTLAGIGSQWNGQPLLVSFFLRSQSISIFPSLSGNVSAYFDRFDVLVGEPVQLGIPEPTSAALASLALLASWRFRV